MRPPTHPRADELLVARGYAPSQPVAAALILAGKVLVTDTLGRERKLAKAGERLPPAVQFRLKGESRRYVSRAGAKLAGALDHFALDVRGRVCADLGLSTGGFTDCLLQRGAERVHGVDVGYGLVDWRLRTDARVVLHERTNVRHLSPDHFGEPVSLITIDLSFIGLRAIWTVIPPLLEASGHVIALVKPQFELARDEVGSGVVEDAKAQLRAVEQSGKDAGKVGLRTHGTVRSSVPGRKGNQEWLIHLINHT